MLNKKTILAVIPARFASARLLGKLLMPIGKQTVIERVYKQVEKCKSLDHIVIATDDDRIYEHVKSFGANVVMTNVNHTSGTDRCMEVFNGMERDFDFLVNIQGDEPFIDASEIDALINLMIRNKADIGTLAYPIHENKDIFNKNIVKVVRSKANNALYFSRSPIPYYSRDKVNSKDILALQHIGLYAFHKSCIDIILNLPSSELEKTENLEQLRWLENDLSIVVGNASKAHIGIDTQEDLDRARKFIEDNKEMY